jgi:arginyl-tRNA synthetase
MQNITHLIKSKITKCFEENLIELQTEPKIVASRLSGIDYCLHDLVQIAKQNKRLPRDIITIVNHYFRHDDMVDTVSSIGNFINFNLKKSYIIEAMNQLYNKENLVCKAEKKLKIVIDYSSPNIAKDMHVGHLRSTIIGDSLANLYEILGHEVIRVNHIGDFGLQFGMIIRYIIDNKLEETLKQDNLQQIYTDAKYLYDNDTDFNKKSHETLIDLQKDDESDICKLWLKICKLSKESYYDIYKKLEIKDMIEVGESYYVKYFDAVIKELQDRNLLILKDGRSIIYSDNISKTSVLTILKSDGGYTYDTTDVAAIRYRLMELKADKVYYIVDSGQTEHFKQIFDTAKRMDWIKPTQHVEHINFGIVKGDDGKRIRSRAGNTPKLIDLLNESIDETTKIMIQKNPLLGNDKKTIDAIAYGSIKYADLAVCRTNDYIFSFTRMLSFKGNTMVYIMYSYVRIQSILRNTSKYVDNILNISADEINDQDIELSKSILQLPEILEIATNTNMMHHVCTYLYDNSDMLNFLYNTQRCIEYDNQKNFVKVNKSRVTIFKILSRVMDISLKIVGISPIDVI